MLFSYSLQLNAVDQEIYGLNINYKTMPCRVGITTNPTERKAYWQNQVIGLTNWRILATYNNKADAQAHENRHALSHGCTAQAGGPNAPGVWSVYKFDYIRTR
ncbi:hypothetical protein QQ008_14140 [Fulvivirgaceae bacterium BMA10]|uniref:Uncharacterized protein n=1 Tax=Splendidivirga corallicola TaxID=3051826 RepID=A0ABT8KQS5_9BACT|nr:hypothetical protein [Fulvivirgaceae bacterium BMA10]